MDHDGDYWNRSASKAFRFDDEDQDDILPTNNSQEVDRTFFGNDNVSEISYDNTSELLNINIHSVIDNENLSIILNEQNLESQTVPKGVSAEDELKILRRQIQYLTNAPSVKDTAYKLILGKRCSLEPYKSLKDKEALLDEVIKIGNGDAILGVTLFIERSLNKTQFIRILNSRPKACNHYINYLNETCPSEAINVLTIVGNHQEAAVLSFKAAVQSNSNLLTKKQRISQILKDYTTLPGILSIYYQMWTNSLSLLDVYEKLNKNPDISIEEISPINILYNLCSIYKWKDVNTTDSLSPFKLMTDQQITPSQFEWVALNERAVSQAFADVIGIFEKTSWHLLNQKQFHINFPLEIAIKRLYDLGAPVAVLYSFLSKVTNQNDKLTLAKKVKCNRAAIDALVSLKESSKLEILKSSLPESSEDRFYCEQAIKTITNRRWSEGINKIIK